MFKLANNEYDPTACNFIKTRKVNTQPCNLREHKTTEHQFSKTSISKNKFTLRTAQTWNSLPKEIINKKNCNGIQEKIIFTLEESRTISQL